MPFVNKDGMFHVMSRMLNRVDERLVGHGEDVAFLTLKMLETKGGYSPRERRDICLTAMLHDIGAYKTEEVSRLVQFETVDVWSHAVYGSVFLKRLSPLAQWAPAVLMHHADYNKLARFNLPHKQVAQMIHLADRVDIRVREGGRLSGLDWLEHFRGAKFSGAVIDLFLRAEREHGMLARLACGDVMKEVWACFHAVPFTRKEIDAYINLVVFAIDFRSEYTVAHTITTRYISEELATLMGLPRGEQKNLRYGALLHDLGKIAIPVEILEAPGGLTTEQMAVMRTHVDITEEIFGGEVRPEVADISLRHHEKLDGTGYPRGLTEAELTPAQRLLAVADIVSALEGVRSYKGAFDRVEIESILLQMKANGQLAPDIVDAFVANYGRVMNNTHKKCEPLLLSYGALKEDYDALLAWCTEG